MTAHDDLIFIQPETLREYLRSLVALNRNSHGANNGEGPIPFGTNQPEAQTLTSEKTDPFSNVVRVELMLPLELAERVDIEVGRRGSCWPTKSRENFLLSALLWSLASIDESLYFTALGLETDSSRIK
jgi:hypothetical protein